MFESWIKQSKVESLKIKKVEYFVLTSNRENGEIIIQILEETVGGDFPRAKGIILYCENNSRLVGTAWSQSKSSMANSEYEFRKKPFPLPSQQTISYQPVLTIPPLNFS